MLIVFISAYINNKDRVPYFSYDVPTGPYYYKYDKFIILGQPLSLFESQIKPHPIVL